MDRMNASVQCVKHTLGIICQGSIDPSHFVVVLSCNRIHNLDTAVCFRNCNTRIRYIYAANGFRACGAAVCLKVSSRRPGNGIGVGNKLAQGHIGLEPSVRFRTGWIRYIAPAILINFSDNALVCRTGNVPSLVFVMVGIINTNIPCADRVAIAGEKELWRVRVGNYRTTFDPAHLIISFPRHGIHNLGSAIGTAHTNTAVPGRNTANGLRSGRSTVNWSACTRCPGTDRYIGYKLRQLYVSREIA